MRIVWTSVAFVAGIAVAMFFGISPGQNIPTFAYWSFVGGGALVAVSLILSRRRAAVALLCLVFLLGCWRGGEAISHSQGFNTQYGAYSAPDRSDGNPIDLVRSFAADRLLSSPLQEHAGLPLALLIADRSKLDADVTNDFRSAGIAHLLAISGLHVSLVGGTAMAFSVMLFGRRRAAYLLMPVCLVLAYAALAGFAPPITRAAIMFCVFVLGMLMGRGSHTLAALSLAAVLMVAWEPALLASLSFQLSFAAMLGISFVAPLLEGITEVSPSLHTQRTRRGAINWIRNFVKGSLLVSLAATVTTLPLVAFHFQAVPVWGPFATLVAVPAMPVLIFVSALVVLVEPVPIVSDVTYFLARLTSDYLTWIARRFAEFPPGPIRTNAWSAWMLWGYYIGLAALIVAWRHASRFAGRSGETILGLAVRPFRGHSYNVGMRVFASVALIVAGLTMLSASIPRLNSPPHLTVTFLQTSLGESIFIETPNGNRMLIDGGGDEYQVAETLNSMLPVWDREIDVVMLTHPDADHVGGLPTVLERFQVGAVLHSDVSASSDVFDRWTKALDHHDEVVSVWPGMTVGLDDGVFFNVISSGCSEGTITCSDANDASIVTKLVYGEISFLFTGDIERAAESRLVATESNLNATILKAPHHGSNTSSTSTLINAVNPVVAVVAAGTENRYGHPHPEVMERLNNQVGSERVFRTDLYGSVRLHTDGERLWTSRWS